MDLLITSAFILSFLLFFCTGLVIGYFVGQYKTIQKSIAGLEDLRSILDRPVEIKKAAEIDMPFKSGPALLKRKPTGSAVLHCPDPETVRKQKEKEALNVLVKEIEETHGPKNGPIPYVDFS